MLTCSICNHPNRPNAKFCANCRAPIILQNKYRVVKLLGRGGYGAVYQAEHTGLGGALYAIKELSPDPMAMSEQQQSASEQFRLEASILAKLNHPGLPKVMDFFTEGKRDYLVMEYVEGETLEERLTRIRAPLPEAQVLAWAQELCDVLTHLHTRQPNPVIHRDVKPSNIKITPDGKLKLIDFGIAKLHAAGVGTQGAARAVSPPYSPIEQYGKGTDARSDIYALGVTLYQLLTNHLPADAPDRASEPVISLRQLNPALAQNTETLVLKAMAEKAAERFQSAREMNEALTARARYPQLIKPVYQQPAPTQQPTPYAPLTAAPEMARQPVGQTVGNSMLVALSVVALISLFVLGIRALVLTRQPETASLQTIMSPTREAMATPMSNVSPVVIVMTATPIPPTSRPVPTDTPRYTPTPRAGEERTIGGVPIVFVPAGEFTMGGNDSDTKPIHTVYLDAYWIDKHEATNAQYGLCVNAGACKLSTYAAAYASSSTRRIYFGNPDFNNFPVINVTWDEANAFCKWAGKHLPTEAEWEKAARGTDARVYPWGNTFDASRLNWCVGGGCSKGDTTAVGSYLRGASPYGAFDMAGNVWEWVADWYEADYYARSPRDNPKGPSSGSSRIVRGGSWNSVIGLRTADRLITSPGTRSNEIGFRCAQ